MDDNRGQPCGIECFLIVEKMDCDFHAPYKSQENENDKVEAAELGYIGILDEVDCPYVAALLLSVQGQGDKGQGQKVENTEHEA